MKLFYLYLPILLILSAFPSHAGDVTQSTFDNELAKTEKLVSEAKTATGLWRDTNKLVEQAIELSREQKYDSAIRLLKEAQFQANSGYQQATSQDNLEDLVPYYLK